MDARAASHSQTSTSRPFVAARSSRLVAARSSRKEKEMRRNALPRAQLKRSSNDDDRPPTTTSTTKAATALALSLSLLLASPPPSLAENVRVEDVNSPSLRAGLEAANEQRWADAERLFKLFLNDEPDSASGWSDLGNVELSTARPRLALEHFDRAVRLAPEAAVPRMNRALAKEALAVAEDESEKRRALLASAAEDARAAAELDPREFAAFFDLGNILERQGKYREALSAFSRAADLAPGLSGYRLREATSMFQVALDDEEATSASGGGADDGGGKVGDGLPEASVPAARRLVAGVTRKNPTYAEAKAASAAMAWQAGDTARAEDALDAATSLDREWKKPGHARDSTRWPPRLVDAYERLLAIE